MNPPLKFVAIAFNDYGGIGFEFYSKTQTRTGPQVLFKNAIKI